MKPRAQGSVVESWAQWCADDEDEDWIEVVVEEGVDAEKILS